MEIYLTTIELIHDSTVAVVVLNLTGQAHDYKIWLAGRAVTTNSPAHSIETALLKP